ncbi:MAG: PLP-dependent aminotransferase family protein [Chloroflexota bacterium]|nr:PLP-dependent aminotransferase family protein [Chloroflexota bacterium]
MSVIDHAGLRLPAGLARRTAAYGPSFWAGLDSLFGLHPDIIYFGGGVPSQELIPVDRLRYASDLAWADAPAALDYGEVAGYRPLRHLIADRMTAQGTPVDAGQVVVTNGSQQAIDLAARLLLNPGDAVVVEAPTFIDAIRSFAAYEATFLEVPVDQDGMRIDALREVLRGAATPPKLIYTIPTFQNPSGTSLSLSRRRELLEVAREHGLAVIEDDPYGELRYDGDPLPSLRSLDPHVIYLGTFSKTIAPGLRVGWVAAPEHLLELFRMAKEGTDIHTARIVTRTVFHAAEGFLDDHVAGLRAVYRARREVLLETLATEMPAGIRWSKPDGGFFVWVELPETINASELLPMAAANGVIFLPGSGFYPNPATGGSHALRLNFSALPEDRIREGIRRLAAVIR